MNHGWNKRDCFNGKSIGNNGKFISYYGDGKSIESKGSYVTLGKTNEGVLYCGGNFCSTRFGQWEFYDQTGKLTAKGNFVNNIQTGMWEEYTVGWDLLIPFIARPLFKQGEKIKSIGQYSSIGCKKGEWISTYDDGKIFSKCNYNGNLKEDGKVNLDPAVKSTINFLKESEFSYPKVVFSGEQVYYYRNGNIMLKYNYSENGKLIGFEEYDEDGNSKTINKSNSEVKSVINSATNEASNNVDKNQNNEVLSIAEQMPSFPGGVNNLYKFLRENIHYPPYCREADIQGKVVISFVVNKDGSLSDIQVQRSVYKALDDEALRLVRSMPNWQAGMQAGEPVRVKYDIPVLFSLH
jgi:TonB family protein